MDNETNQSLSIESANVRTPEPIEGPFRLLHLADEIEKLWQEPFWQGGRNSKTLVKRPDLRIVLTGLKANHQLHEHQAVGSISVQALKGHIVMHVMDWMFDLPVGRMLTLEEALPHNVEALEDSAYLLTIAWPETKRI
jgi:quercetin dioxygenase-like cupin family protein